MGSWKANLIIAILVVTVTVELAVSCWYAVKIMTHP